MPTLHMDVEVARNSQSTLANIAQQMQQELASASNSVSGLMGSWQGNSATEFNGLFDSFNSAAKNQVDQLTELANRLSAEITEWETAAAKLGGG